MTTVFLIRHCETIGNKQGVFQGRIDMNISEAGQEQLEQLKTRFKKISLDVIYSSPLLRARRTAEAVRGERNLMIIDDDRLVEIDGGIWEGKRWCDLPTLDPEQSRLWVEKPCDFATQEGEPMRSVYTRMSQALLTIAEENDGKQIAIVSHGCAIRNTICFANGWPIERLHEVGWCDNTGVNQLHINNGHVEIIAENDHSHLQKQASANEQKAWWRG